VLDHQQTGSAASSKQRLDTNSMQDAPPQDAPTRLISYAQNLEDIMLNRALAAIERGTYVDVGAAWPKFDSVTNLFYERGWSGINIEPNPELLESLRRERPRDVNLGVAIGDHPGSATFAVVQGTGLSTLDLELAETHRGRGYDIRTIDVAIETLQAILDKHLPDDEIQFLKIDAEGFEAAVIAGNDWGRFRPWIVVVEVVTAAQAPTAPPSWESELVGARYARAYDDGINRFYVADEHPELLPAFRTPPNILDGFVTARLAEAEDGLAAAEAQAGHLAWELDLARQHSEWLASEGEAKERRLASLVNDLELREQRSAWLSSQLESAEQARVWLLGEIERVTMEGRARQRQAYLAAASALAAIAEEALRRLEHELRTVGAERDELRRRVDLMLGSRSWKVTRPLRIAFSLRQAPGPGLKYIASRLVGDLPRRALGRVVPVARLAHRVRDRRLGDAPSAAPAAPDPPVLGPPTMTPYESDFAALVDAVAAHHDAVGL
jgi:FkbM family methyltransferase